jgi:hypothetical protein
MHPHYFFKAHFNIILPSMPIPSKWFFSSDFPTRTLYSPFIFPYTCYMPRPSQSALFHHLNNNWYRAQLTKLLIMQSFPFPYYRGAHKSLARSGRKQDTATEDFDFYISYL